MPTSSKYNWTGPLDLKIDDKLMIGGGDFGGSKSGSFQYTPTKKSVAKYTPPKYTPQTNQTQIVGITPSKKTPIIQVPKTGDTEFKGKTYARMGNDVYETTGGMKRKVSYDEFKTKLQGLNLENLPQIPGSNPAIALQKQIELQNQIKSAMGLDISFGGGDRPSVQNIAGASLSTYGKIQEEEKHKDAFIAKQEKNAKMSYSPEAREQLWQGQKEIDLFIQQQKSSTEKLLQQQKEKYETVKNYWDKLGNQGIRVQGRNPAQHEKNMMKLLENTVENYDAILNRFADKPGFFQGMKKGMASHNVEELLPFVSSVVGFAKATDVLAVARKQQRGEKLSNDEQIILAEFVSKSLKDEYVDESMAESVGAMIAMFPGFAVEYASSGGISKVASTGVETVVSKSLPKFATEALSIGAGAFARTSTVFSPRVAQSTVERMAPHYGIVEGKEKRQELDTLTQKTQDYNDKVNLYNDLIARAGSLSDAENQALTQLEKQLERDIKNIFDTYTKASALPDLEIAITKQGDSFDKAFIKAFGSTYVEVLSEELGRVVENPTRFLKNATINKYLAKIGIDSVEKVSPSTLKTLEKIGWNGIFGEVFEEEIAYFLQSPIEGYDYKNPFTTEEGRKRLLTETLGITAIGGGFGVFGQIEKAQRSPESQAGFARFGVPEDGVDAIKQNLEKQKEFQQKVAEMQKAKETQIEPKPEPETDISESIEITSQIDEENRITQAFNKSKNQRQVGEFEIGTLGENQFARKAGQKDRFPMSELVETQKYITNAYRANDQPNNYRKDNIAWISKMPNGETRVIYTRQNAKGAEEIINGHIISNFNFEETLKTYGSPSGSRTHILSLERRQSNPLTYGAEPSLPQKISTSQPEASKSPSVTDDEMQYNKNLTRLNKQIQRATEQSESIVELKKQEKKLQEARDRANKYRKDVGALKRELKNVRNITRRETEQGIRTTKQEIKTFQENIIKALDKSDLDASDKAKFIKSVKNVQTFEQLEKAIPEIEQRIERLEKQATRRNLKAQIKKELDKFKSKKDQKGKTTVEYETIRAGYKQILNNTQAENEMLLSQLEANMELQKEGAPLDFQEITTYALLTESTKGYGEMSNTELDDVLTRVQQTKKIARDSFLWKQIEKSERIRTKISTAVNNMMPRKVSGDIASNRRTIRDKLVEYFKRADMQDRGLAQIMNLLDKTAGTQFFNETIYQPVMESNKSFFVEDGKYKDKDKMFFEETYDKKGNLLDMRLKKLHRDTHVGEFVDGKGRKVNLFYTPDEMIDIYISAQMRTNRTAMFENGIYDKDLHGNKVYYMTQEILDVIDSKLGKEEKATADYILNNIRDKDFTRRMTDAYEAKYNKPFPFVQGGYWGIKRHYTGAKQKGINIFKPEYQEKTVLSPASMKQRVENDNPVEIQGGFSKYIAHRNDILQFIHYNESLSELLTVIGSKEFKSQFIDNYTDKSYRHLYDSFFYKANGGEKYTDGYAKTANYVRSVLSIAYIGGKTRNILSQGSSAIASMAGMPVKDVVKSFTNFTTNPMKAYDKMMESPLVRYRHKRADFTRGMFEETARQNFGMKAPDVAMFFTKVGDIVGVVGSGYTVYDYHYRTLISQGMSPLEADRKAMIHAENFFISTQQSALPEYANKLMQSHPVIRISGSFQQAQSMYRAKGYEAIVEWQNSDKTRADTLKMFKQVATYHLVLPAMYELSRGNLNPLSIGVKSAFSPISGFMGYGKIIEYVVMYAVVKALIPILGGDDDDYKDLLPFSLTSLPSEAIKLFEQVTDSIGDMAGGEGDDKDILTILMGLGTLLEVPVKNITEEYQKVDDILHGRGGLYRLLQTEWQNNTAAETKYDDLIHDGEYNEARKYYLEQLKKGYFDGIPEELTEKEQLQFIRNTFDKINSKIQRDIKEQYGLSSLTLSVSDNVIGEERTEKMKEMVQTKINLAKMPQDVFDELVKVSGDSTGKELKKARTQYREIVPESEWDTASVGKDEDKDWGTTQADYDAAHRNMFELIGAYTKAYGTDPRNAFKAMFTGEQLGEVEGNLVEMARFKRISYYAEDGSQEYKKQLMEDMGLDWEKREDYKLEHLVPVKAGGDTSDDNLYVVDTTTHNSYTPVDILASKKIKAGDIKRKQVEDVMKKLKINKSITVTQAIEELNKY